MKLLVGLGNPESDYSFTRHNAGKDLINLFVQKEYSFHGWDYNKKLDADIIRIDDQFFIAKPRCFMNESGDSVMSILKYFKMDRNDDLIVAYDELDLFVGEYKLSKGKGSKIHNGVISINNVLKTADYWHLRIGVRDETIAMSVQKAGRDPSRYVLEKLSLTDRKKIEYTNTSSVIPALNSLLGKK